MKLLDCWSLVIVIESYPDGFMNRIKSHETKWNGPIIILTSGMYLSLIQMAIAMARSCWFPPWATFTPCRYAQEHLMFHLCLSCSGISSPNIFNVHSNPNSNPERFDNDQRQEHFSILWRAFVDFNLDIIEMIYLIWDQRCLIRNKWKKIAELSCFIRESGCWPMISPCRSLDTLHARSILSQFPFPYHCDVEILHISQHHINYLISCSFQKSFSQFWKQHFRSESRWASHQICLEQDSCVPSKEDYLSKLRDDAMEATPTATTPHPQIIKSLHPLSQIMEKPSWIERCIELPKWVMGRK
jgi:hypothetical protein